LRRFFLLDRSWIGSGSVPDRFRIGPGLDAARTRPGPDATPLGRERDLAPSWVPPGQGTIVAGSTQPEPDSDAT